MRLLRHFRRGSSSRVIALLARPTRLATSLAVTLASLTRTLAIIPRTVALRLIRARHGMNTHRRLLLLLQIRKTKRLSVNIHDLLLALAVELHNLLARRGTEGLLEVGAQSAPARGRTVSDAIRGIERASLVRGLGLAVEVGERLREAVRDAVLVVEVDRSVESLVAEDVAVGEVLGDDAGARLVLLLDLVGVLAVGVTAVGGLGGAAGDLVDAVGRGHLYLGGAQLGVVEEEGGLGGAVEKIVS